MPEPRDEITRIIEEMRSERSRYKSHDLGYVDSVSASRVDEWADELEAALASRPVSSWQPIETAPRPTRGRKKVIDVWCVTDDYESAAFYFGNTCSGVKDRMLWQGRVSEVYWLDGAWRPANGLRMHGLTVTPTHWMPLPDSPSEGVAPRPVEPLENFTDDEAERLKAARCARCGCRADQHIHLFGSNGKYLCPTVGFFREDDEIADQPEAASSEIGE